MQIRKELFLYHFSLKNWRKPLGSFVQANDLNVSSVWMPLVFATSNFCSSSVAHFHTVPYPTQVCAWTSLLFTWTIITICTF